MAKKNNVKADWEIAGDRLQRAYKNLHSGKRDAQEEFKSAVNAFRDVVHSQPVVDGYVRAMTGSSRYADFLDLLSNPFGSRFGFGFDGI